MLTMEILVHDVHVTGSMGRRVFRAQERVQFFPTPLTLESFLTERDDDGATSWQEVLCPCGEALSYDGSVADAVHVSRVHAMVAHRIYV